MLAIASQIIICLILAALIGGVIGYLLGKASCAEKNKCHKEVENKHALHIDQRNNTTVETETAHLNEKEAKVQAVGVKPTLLSEAREGGKDNLQLIKGVGKVLEEVLNETGIYHFDQIANLSDDEIKWLDNSMSFPGRIRREAWVAQSKELARGKSTEFSERVEQGKVSSSKQSK